MRIGLIIFPFVPSHGSILQTYAIYMKLKEMGHSVTIINRVLPPTGIKIELGRAFYSLINKIKGVYHGPIYYRGYAPKAIMKNLRPFINSNFGKDIVTIYRPEDTRTFVRLNKFDAFVVGSDQVWRPKFIPDIYHYYLDFLPVESKVKRIAFCPSFGTDEWEYSENQTNKCRTLISYFDYVAVRENSGVDFCRKYLNRQVIQLYDPTILYPAPFYSALFNHSKNICKAITYNCDIASVYYLDYTESKKQIVDRVCSVLHIKANYVNNKIQDYNAPLRDRIAPSIPLWIRGIALSEFVITDSFHATLFALYYNKPFITVMNMRRGGARFTSLLGGLGLMERIVSSIEDVTEQLIKKTIDWISVNKSLDEQRGRSLSFLTNSLNVEDNFTL